jgi:hypothetical protein
MPLRVAPLKILRDRPLFQSHIRLFRGFASARLRATLGAFFLRASGPGGWLFGEVLHDAGLEFDAYGYLEPAREAYQRALDWHRSQSAPRPPEECWDRRPEQVGGSSAIFPTCPDVDSHMWWDSMTARSSANTEVT